MERQIISRKQATKLTSVSIKTIDRWIRQGRIQAFKPFESNRVLIYADTLSEENLKAVKPKFQSQI